MFTHAPIGITLVVTLAALHHLMLRVEALRTGRVHTGSWSPPSPSMAHHGHSTPRWFDSWTMKAASDISASSPGG